MNFLLPRSPVLPFNSLWVTDVHARNYTGYFHPVKKNLLPGGQEISASHLLILLGSV